MLIKIDDEHAALAWISPDMDGLRLIDRKGAVTERDLGGRTGALKVDAHGKLILRSGDAAVIVNPSDDFMIKDAGRCECTRVQRQWSVAFLGLLVDSKSEDVSRFSLDPGALAVPDVAYIEPSDATLLPNGREVAVTIAHSPHMAVFDFGRGETRLVKLAGKSGNANAILDDDALWVVNYDTLCRVDLESYAVNATPTLQPPYWGQELGHVSAFVGVPAKSTALDGWLVPRPYSGDILLVSSDSLSPRGRVPCGGRPYALAEFDDGTLVILDYPFNAFQTASVFDLVSL